MLINCIYRTQAPAVAPVGVILAGQYAEKEYTNIK